MDVKDGLMMTTVDPSGIIMKNATGVETIKIDGANGNVGIGTNDPSAQLDISGTVKVFGISRFGTHYEDDACVNIRPIANEYALNIGHRDKGESELWRHYVNGDNDYQIDSLSGRNFLLNVPGSINFTSTASNFNFNTRTLYYKKPSASAMRFIDTNTTTGNAQNYIIKGHAPGDNDGTGGDCLRMWVNGTAYGDFTTKSSVIDNPTGTLYLGNYAQKVIIYGGDNYVGEPAVSGHGKYLRFMKSTSDGADFTLSSTWVSSTTMAGIFNSFNLHIDSASNPQGNGTPGHIYLNWHNHAGGIFIGDGVSVSSDERIKTNIKVIDDNEALDKILALETVSYNLIEDGDDAPKKIGFIAQQIKKIIPDAVSEAFGHDASIMKTFDFTVVDVPITEESEAHHILKIDTDILEDGESYRLVYSGYERDFVATVEDGITTFKTHNKWDFELPKKIKIVGKNINDFMRVRHEDIYNLHHSGIQQLHKNNVALEAKVDAINLEKNTLIAELQAENTNLKNEISLIKQHLGI